MKRQLWVGFKAASRCICTMNPPPPSRHEWAAQDTQAWSSWFSINTARETAQICRICSKKRRSIARFTVVRFTRAEFANPGENCSHTSQKRACTQTKIKDEGRRSVGGIFTKMQPARSVQYHTCKHTLAAAIVAFGVNLCAAANKHVEIPQ